MSILSIVRPSDEGVKPLVMASPVFVLSNEAERRRGLLRFEVLGPDSYGLIRHVGVAHLLTLDGGAPFWGRLETLEPRKLSTHPDLAPFRGHPTVLATMTIGKDAEQEPLFR